MAKFISLDDFVDEVTIEIVRVGISERDIKASRDKDFNDIEIKRWELITPALDRHLRDRAKALNIHTDISFFIAVAKVAAHKLRDQIRARSVI